MTGATLKGDHLMHVIRIRLLPRRHRNGRVVIDEVTYYDETVPGMPWVNQSRRRLWPHAKLITGRGRQFVSAAAARHYVKLIKTVEATANLLQR